MIWCLHGALGSYRDWDFLSEDLSDVQPVDLWQDFPELELSAWAEAFCSHVQGCDQRPVLLGYSMGGRLALHALLARPTLWQSAIVVSAHPGLAAVEERDGTSAI